MVFSCVHCGFRSVFPFSLGLIFFPFASAGAIGISSLAFTDETASECTHRYVICQSRVEQYVRDDRIDVILSAFVYHLCVHQRVLSAWLALEAKRPFVPVHAFQHVQVLSHVPVVVILQR